MKITGGWLGSNGVRYDVEYVDADSFDELPLDKCKQVYGVCFHNNKMIIGWGGHKQAWGLIGGSIETGEALEETLAREIKEESNMRILKSKPIGYQKVTDTRDGSYIYQLRYACITEPYGPFISDPDGGITEIAFINPDEYKKYFDWGEIGDRIIKRAIEMKNAGI